MMNSKNKEITNFLNEILNSEINEFNPKSNQELNRICLLNSLNSKEFKNLQKLSKLKGGFQTYCQRKVLWKLILSTNKIPIHSNYLLEVTDTKEEIIQKKYFQNSDTCKWFDYKALISNYDNIIRVDCDRSIINQKNYNHSNDTVISYIKEDLKYLLNNVFLLLNKKYHYFQGFHDISLFIYLLFIEDDDKGLIVLQRFSEFFFANYMTEMKNKEVPGFEHFCLVLSTLIRMKVPEEYELITSSQEFEPFFAFSWFITWFTHNINSFSLIYRIMDFLICHHPIAVFHLSAEIIASEIKKLVLGKSKESIVISNWHKSNMNIYDYFQNLNLEKINIDEMINKTAESIELIKLEDLFDQFKDRITFK